MHRSKIALAVIAVLFLGTAVDAKTSRKRAAAAKAPEAPITSADLRWPCWAIKMYRKTHSEAEAAAEGKRRGIKISGRELKAVQMCLDGLL